MIISFYFVTYLFLIFLKRKARHRFTGYEDGGVHNMGLFFVGGRTTVWAVS